MSDINKIINIRNDFASLYNKEIVKKKDTLLYSQTKYAQARLETLKYCIDAIDAGFFREVNQRQRLYTMIPNRKEKESSNDE